MSNVSNIDDFHDTNECGVLCPVLFGVFIGMILLYTLFCCQAIYNKFNKTHEHETDITEDLLENEC